MADQALPSINPAMADELPGALMSIISKYIASNVDDMLPAEVVAYDAATNVATVKPMIMMMDTAGELISRGNVSVPVFTMGGGDALIRFKIRAGSLGWIKANDRDVSLFIQDKKESAPNTFRAHQFDDAIFFPDFLREWTVHADDAEALAVIQNASGTVRVSVFSDKIEMTAPTINTKGAMNHTGNLTVTGGITATSDIVSDSEVTAGAVSLTTHTHQYIPAQHPAGAPTDTTPGTG